MISEISGIQIDKKIEAKKIMPPRVTACILIFMICFIFISRGFAGSWHEDRIPAMSRTLITGDETRHSTYQDLEIQLSNILQLFDLNESNSDHKTLKIILKEDMLDKKIDFSEEDMLRLQDSLLDLQEIIRLEEVGEFKKMSLEGRKVIIYLTKEIFELYGFRLAVSIDGRIEKILDSAGNLVYSAPQLSLMDNQLKGLAIVISIVILALLLCILLAKKNQLFKKEVIYDGLNKKRYA